MLEFRRVKITQECTSWPGCWVVLFCPQHIKVLPLLVAFHFKVSIIFCGLAALVSLIAKPNEPDLIKSVDELVRQDEISWLIEAGSAFANFGMDAEEGTTLR